MVKNVKNIGLPTNFLRSEKDLKVQGVIDPIVDEVIMMQEENLKKLIRDIRIREYAAELDNEQLLSQMARYEVRLEQFSSEELNMTLEELINRCKRNLILYRKKYCGLYAEILHRMGTSEEEIGNPLCRYFPNHMIGGQKKRFLLISDDNHTF